MDEPELLDRGVQSCGALVAVGKRSTIVTTRTAGASRLTVGISVPCGLDGHRARDEDGEMSAANRDVRDEATGRRGMVQRKSAMERVIETVASGLGNGVGWLAENGLLFAIFAIIWIAFGAALVWSQGSLDQAWRAIRDLPLIAQAVVWVLFLPVVGGLWIWESTWPLVVRLVLVLGIAGWNLLIFLPKALQGPRP
jgi:hypothetical protein